MTLSTCPDCGNPISSEAVACPKCGRPPARNRSRTIALSLALVVGGLVALNSYYTYVRTSTPIGRVYHRGVHSGLKEQVAFYYDLAPDCRVQGYPDVMVTRPPRQGALLTEQGKANSEYTRENIRFECNRHPVGATLVFYQSKPSFRGRDWFTISVRFPETGALWTESYVVDVR